MKKVVTIHLAGRLFQIEEDAFSKLESVLNRLRIQDPGHCDTLEIHFAEYFQNQTELGQRVVTLQMVLDVMREKGISEAYGTTGKGNEIPYKRIFRRRSGRVVGGVCSGLGYVWGVDPVLLRLLFIVLFIGFGFGILLYLVMWILIPQADEVD